MKHTGRMYGLNMPPCVTLDSDSQKIRARFMSHARRASHKHSGPTTPSAATELLFS